MVFARNINDKDRKRRATDWAFGHIYILEHTLSMSEI